MNCSMSISLEGLLTTFVNTCGYMAQDLTLKCIGNSNCFPCNMTLLLLHPPQGMIVSILFCLINNEVIFQVKKFFADRTGFGQGGRHPSLALTQYTVGFK